MLPTRPTGADRPGCRSRWTPGCANWAAKAARRGVVNISDTGFMAESAGDFEVGSRIWLILPARDRASAIVRWTAGDKLGAEFSEPISLDGLDLSSRQPA